MPGLRGSLLLALLLATGLLGACASTSPLTRSVEGRGVELRNTPFFPQQEMLCGPAALATMLSASGIAVTPVEIAPRVYLPGRRGSLQVEMQAAARGYQRLAYRLPSTLRAIHAELLAGRPVLVLQNLAVTWLPVYHYAVVIGIDPDAQSLILRSGTDRRLEMSLEEFARSWQRAGSWALVLLDSTELPAEPEAERYLAAIAAMEQGQQYPFTTRAYETALSAWPDHPVALFGLANSLMGQQRYRDAEQIYRRLVEIQPGNLLLINNLALAMAEQGCRSEALVLLNQELSRADVQAAIKGLLQQTRQDIAESVQRSKPLVGDCPERGVSVNHSDVSATGKNRPIP